MKKTSKYIFAVFISFTTATIFPVSVQALDNSISNIKNTALARAEELTSKKTEACKKFSTSRLGEKSNDRKSVVEKESADRLNSLTSKRSEWDAKRLEVRTLADGKRLEHYEKLSEKAITEEQTQSVEDFRMVVEDAVTKRRASQDEAKDIYRSSVDSAIAEQAAEIKSATDELKLAIDAAVAKAKTACENGTPVDEVTKVLRADLESAQVAFKESRADVGALKEKIKALAETRRAAAEAARLMFEAEIAAAKESLKEAFNLNS